MCLQVRSLGHLEHKWEGLCAWQSAGDHTVDPTGAVLAVDGKSGHSCPAFGGICHVTTVTGAWLLRCRLAAGQESTYCEGPVRSPPAGEGLVYLVEFRRLGVSDGGRVVSSEVCPSLGIAKASAKTAELERGLNRVGKVITSSVCRSHVEHDECPCLGRRSAFPTAMLACLLPLT